MNVPCKWARVSRTKYKGKPVAMQAMYAMGVLFTAIMRNTGELFASAAPCTAAGSFNNKDIPCPGFHPANPIELLHLC